MAEKIVLPPRLRVIAEAAGPCRCVADIGTDHALLPVYMIQSGLCRSAYACDLNEGPLQRARQAIEKAEVGSLISCVKSDGLHSVPEDYDVLVIAGMGGDLISRILWEHPPVCAERMILQPMTKPEVLRRFLFRHGYSIEREQAVTEGEKRYVVMTVLPVATESFTEFDCYVPQRLDCVPDALDYIEKLLNSHQKRLQGLRRSELPDPQAVSFEAEMERRLRRLWQDYSRRLYDETH